MTTRLIVICTLLFFAPMAHAGEVYHEKYYQEKWCNEHGGQLEFVLPDGARVDCLTDELAVEFDWAKKWAEGYGQAKYYAAMTGRRGAVVLIVRGDGHDQRYVRRLQIAAASEVDIHTMVRQQQNFPFCAETRSGLMCQ